MATPLQLKVQIKFDTTSQVLQKAASDIESYFSKHNKAVKVALTINERQSKSNIETALNNVIKRLNVNKFTLDIDEKSLSSKIENALITGFKNAQKNINNTKWPPINQKGSNGGSGGDGSGDDDGISSDEFSRLLKIKRLIGGYNDKIEKINALDPNAVNQLEQYREDIENLEEEVANLENRYSEFSDSQKRRFDATEQDIARVSDDAMAKIDDALNNIGSKTKKQTEEFSRLLQMIKAEGNKKIELGKILGTSANTFDIDNAINNGKIPAGQEEKVTALRENLRKISNEVNKLYKSLSATFATEQTEKYNAALRDVNRKIKEANAEVIDSNKNAGASAEEFKKLISAINEEASKSNTAKLLEASSPNRINEINELKAQAEAARLAKESLYNSISQQFNPEQAKAYQDALETIKQKEKEVNAIILDAIKKRTVEEAKQSMAQETSLNNSIASFRKWADKNKEAIKASNVSSMVDELNDKIKNNTIKTSAALRNEWSKILKEISESSKSVSVFGNLIGSAVGLLKSNAVSIVKLFASAKIREALTDIVKYVVEIDTAMTELKKVTDETNATYSSFLSNAGARAKELGASVSDVVSATADFARLGYSIEDATKIADAAIVYKNVGDGIKDIGDASDAIISTMKAFGIETDNVMSIVDRFNAVGNRFSISSKDIGEALTRSAASLEQAGNSLNQSIGMIVAGNEVIRNPESVGTAIKTLSVRLTQTKVQMQEMGEETEFAAETTSTYRDKLLALTSATSKPVDIMNKAKTAYRAPYEILKDMAEVWDEMNQAQQQAALYLMGGARQANVLKSIISNMSEAEDVVATAANSAGSALEENEKYLDSIQGRLSQLKAAWQDLAADVLDSRLIKGAVSFLTGVVDFLDDIIERLDFITPLLDALQGGTNNGRQSSLKGNASASSNDWKEQEKLAREYSDRIATIKDQIDNLDRLDKSITDAGDIDRLKQEKAALEGQLAIIRERQRLLAEETNNNAYNWFKRADRTGYTSVIGREEEVVNGEGTTSKSLVYDDIGITQYISELVTKYNNLNAVVNATNKTVEDGGNLTKEQLATHDKNIEDMATLQKLISETYAEAADVAGKAIDDGSEQYSSVIDTFNTISDIYNNFVGNIISGEEEIEEANQGAEESFKNLITSYGESVGQIQENMDLLDKAVKSINSDGGIDGTTFSKLIDNNLLQYLNQTANGFEINKAALLDTAEAARIKAQNDLQAAYAADVLAIAQGDVCAEGSPAAGILNAAGAAAQAAGQQAASGASGFFTLAGAISIAKTAGEGGLPKDFTAKINNLNSVYNKLSQAINSVKINTDRYTSSAGGASKAAGGAAKANKELTNSLKEEKSELEKVKKELQDQQKLLKTQGQAAVKEIEKRIKAIKDEQKAQDEYYDNLIDKVEEERDKKKDAYNDEIEALNERKKALEKSNDEEDRAIKLAELQAELSRAQNQRNVRVYSADTGFEWQADQNAVTNAQASLDEQHRNWSREDAVNSIDDEIDAINNLIDALEEETQKQIDSINTDKDAYDQGIDGQIEKLEELKDKWSDAMSLIGMSWDEYQMMLSAQAEFSAMSFDEMSTRVVEYKDSVVENMRQIADIEAQVEAAENRLSEANKNLSGGSDGGTGGGGGGGGSFAGVGEAANSLREKYGSLLSEIESLANRNDELAQKEALLTNELLNTSEESERYGAIIDELSGIKAESAANTDLINQKSAEYVTQLGLETNATQEEIGVQVEALTTLLDNYNTHYETIGDLINTYVTDLISSGTITEDQAGKMSSAIGLFNEAAKTHLIGTDGEGSVASSFSKTASNAQIMSTQVCSSLDNIVSKLNEIAIAAEDAILAIDEVDRKKTAGGKAVGSRYINTSGRYIVDEQGKGSELIARGGRYTYLERGDSVIPASFTNNLWDIGSNPGAWFERQYNKYSNANSYAPVVRAGDSVSQNIGDIIINNPVSNVNDLARSIERDFANVALQIVKR